MISIFIDETINLLWEFFTERLLIKPSFEIRWVLSTCLPTNGRIQGILYVLCLAIR